MLLLSAQLLFILELLSLIVTYLNPLTTKPIIQVLTLVEHQFVDLK